VKITGAADKPLQLIRRYKNEQLPSVAVTVDLLTTGVDVPAITNLVFLRRVRSRILYEQMLGRATRLCEAIGKESFRIFDAVALYEALEPVTTMKPVVTKPDVSFAQLAEEIREVDDPEARQVALDQFIAKLQRRKQRLKGEALDRFRGITQMSPGEVAAQLTHSTPAEAAEWLKQHSFVLSVLEGSVDTQPVFISEHQDELRRVEHGYGAGKKPDDYLAEFERFVQGNLNQLPALIVVAQRPKELTRKDLKELALKLADAGFSETALQAAWRHKTNEDIAATIIGFVRKAALGDPLVPYAERVERAIRKLLASRPWTDPQRKWLDRIGKQLVKEKVVDRASLDGGIFGDSGGFARINKAFDGKLEAVLGELADEIWRTAG
jgi:type I restriction enzyme R subunit